MRGRRIPGLFLMAAAAAGALMTPAGAADMRLVRAARDRDLTAVRSLVQQRADVNAPDADGMTALHWAAHWDEPALVNLLLAAGADPKATNRYGVTPLHEAAVVADTPMIEALLKAGADPNAGYGAGETPLMTAARTGDVAAVKLLLDHGAEVNAAEEFRGETPLMFAAAENHVDAVKLLISRGASVNARSRKYDFGKVDMANGGAFVDRPEGGLTALFFAVRENAAETANALIAAGAELSVQETQYGFTPLMTAIFNGHYDLAGMLVENGADANDGSLYVLMEMRNLGFYKNRPNPPDRDARLSTMDVLKMLLDHGADPNKPYEKKIPAREAQGDIKVVAGATPLYRAAQSADVEGARFLIQRGAKPSVSTTDHTTPLMAAIQHKGSDPTTMIKALLEAGADVNAANDLGFTAMHYAAQAHNKPLLDLLTASGGRLDVKNKVGKTPLDLL